MTRALRYLSVAIAMLSAACNVSIPEGKFKCSQDADCPDGWVCAEAACYSKRPDNLAGGDAGQNGGANAGDGSDGGNAGSNAGDGGSSDPDASIDTTSCDAFTTFYRDSDTDGLGAAAESIAACSVSSGYVTNADDCNDLCTACTKPDALEICDGLDNECDGKVDDGALEFSTRVSFDELPKSFWGEVVEIPDGGVMFSPASDGMGGVSLKAQRFDTNGAAVGPLVTIPGASPSGAYNLAADQLNGKIVLAWLESDGVKATVLKASDLSTLVAEKVVGVSSGNTPALDVALSNSASGGRALFAFEVERGIRVHSYRITDLVTELPEAQTIYTPTTPNSAAPMVTLAAGPCLSGFYAVVLDMFLNVLRVVPLGDKGMPSGTSYNVPVSGDLVFTAWPALRVEGGSCDAAPSRLVLGYTAEKTALGAESSEIHVDYLTIARVMAADSFALTGSLKFNHVGAVLPAYYFYPSGAFFIQRSLDLMPYEGRYLLSLATAASVTADKAGLDVFEVDGESVVGSHKAVDVQPAGPRSLQLVVLQGRAWLGTASWTNMDPAGLMRIGCGGTP